MVDEDYIVTILDQSHINKHSVLQELNWLVEAQPCHQSFNRCAGIGF